MGKNKYDAFISYRHSELDKFVAVNLHRKLENFKLPKKYRKKCGKSKIERVFRDQDELPLSSNLSNSIDEALHNTDFLIVICSPRLPQSQWCMQEIDTFISLYGRERILAVLCEGEPDESFPEALTKERNEKIDENGEAVVEYKAVEPLAADVRCESKAKINKALDDAVLRIAAPMFGLDYDDLKQRHRERKLKRLISFISVVAAVLLVFSLVSMSMALRIKSQSNQIEIQNEEITKRNEEIEQQYLDASRKYAISTAQNAEKLISYGRKKDALYALLQAMPESSADTLYPYTAETEKALFNALEPYPSLGEYTMGNVYEVESDVEDIRISYDGKYSLICDSLCHFNVWNNETSELVYSGEIPTYYMSKEEIAFTDEKSILYINAQNEAVRVSLDDGKETMITGEANFVRAAGNADRYVIFKDSEFVFYDMSTDAVITSIPIQLNNIFINNYLCSCLSDSGKYFAVAVNSDEGRKIILYDMDEGAVVSEHNMGEADINDICMDADKAYVLCGNFDTNAGELYTGTVAAFNFKDGKEVWRTEIDNNAQNGIVSDGEQSTLFVKSFWCVYSLDINTGEVKERSEADASLLTLDSHARKDSVFMFSAKGYYCIFPGQGGEIMASDYFYTSPGGSISDVAVSGSGILVCYDVTNYVVYYPRCLEITEESFQIPLDKISDLNKAGTKALELTKNENGDNVLLLCDIESGEAVSINYSGRDYFFVGDGSEEFAVLKEDDIEVFSVEDGVSLRRFADGEIMKGRYSVSEDGSFIMFMETGSDCAGSIYDVKTGEKTLSVKMETLSYDDTFKVIDKDKFVIEKDGAISVFCGDGNNPVATKTISKGLVSGYFTSDDRKYYGITYRDKSVEILNVNNLEVVASLYDVTFRVDSMNKTDKGYNLFDGNGIVVLNEDLKETARVDFTEGFVPGKGYIKKSYDKWYINRLLSYDDLISMAKEELGDYVPSERIMKQYNIMSTNR